MQEYQSETFASGSEAIRNEANAWLARFAPLVMRPNPGETAREVNAHLETIASLRSSAPAVQSSLRNLIGSDSIDLSATFEKARDALDSVETDLRKRLAALAPGNPQGIVDLEALNRELEERKARQEIGVPVAGEIPPVLDLQTSPGNLAAAGGLSIFAFGWLSFTTFHMVLMIGGMMRSFGFGALALLPFYGIFFAAGFAMAAGAYKAGAKETITLDGRHLTVKQEMLGIRRQKTHAIAPDAKATVGSSRTTMRQQNDYRPSIAVLIPDSNGRPISIGVSMMNLQLRQIADQINAYLAVYGN